MTTTADSGYRYEPSCTCGWVGRPRKDRDAAQRTADRHYWRECPDSDSRVRVDIRSLIALRQAWS